MQYNTNFTKYALEDVLDITKIDYLISIFL